MRGARGARGARGGRRVRFTAPDGSDFVELAAPGSDFTNRLIDGKIGPTKISTLQSIKWPSGGMIGAVRFAEA